MRRYFFISMPKPMSFVITVLVVIIMMLAISSLITDNALPVGTGGVKANATLEDITERLYEELERR